MNEADRLEAYRANELERLITLNTGKCRACEKPIVWAVNVSSGKRAPLERLAIPGTGGTFGLEVVAGHLTYTAAATPGHRYASHFATCPQADSFRRVTVREHERVVPKRRPREAPEETRPEAEAGAHARHTDPETSHAAAASVSAEARRGIRRTVLMLLGARARTDEELLEAWPFADVPATPSGIRTRRAELAQEEPPLVRDSGERRRTKSGRAAIVWEAVA